VTKETSMDPASTTPDEDARSRDVSEDTINRMIANGNTIAAMRLRADLAEQQWLNLRAALRDMREQTDLQPERVLLERGERKRWLSFRRAG